MEWIKYLFDDEDDDDDEFMKEDFALSGPDFTTIGTNLTPIHCFTSFSQLSTNVDGHTMIPNDT